MHFQPTGLTGTRCLYPTYIGLVLFLVVWLAYKIKHKTKMIPLEECDFEVE